MTSKIDTKDEYRISIVSGLLKYMVAYINRYHPQNKLNNVHIFVSLQGLRQKYLKILKKQENAAYRENVATNE